MPKIAYEKRNFREGSLVLISQANTIITEYQAQGYSLTLRQLYYQFVARGLIANSQKEYGRLGSVINKARMAGLIDWNAIEDLTRVLKGINTLDDPSDAIRECSNDFRIDMWKNQDHRIEVWVEKEALINVVARICNQMRVDFFACRGYTSQSSQWRAAQRLEMYQDEGQTPVVLHLGDHDPSGIDMTRDITDRFDTFMGGVEMRRLALNMDQVEEHNPPPNPAKLTDTRAKGYINKFGNESWELDALNPNIISNLIEETILEYREDGQWETDLEVEEHHRKTLRKASHHWNSVDKFLKGKK